MNLLYFLFLGIPILLVVLGVVAYNFLSDTFGKYLMFYHLQDEDGNVTQEPIAYERAFKFIKAEAGDTCSLHKNDKLYEVVSVAYDYKRKMAVMIIKEI